ncbi:MAG: hypothetical protein LUI87_06990 [Lachnospiraceae bacterium]|nr:hypothetical protein [Lachnospiraceae bacterium]
MAMAQTQGYNRGYVLSAKRSKELFKKLNDSRPSKEFWDDCSEIRKHINKDTIANMNALMDAEDS